MCLSVHQKLLKHSLPSTILSEVSISIISGDNSYETQTGIYGYFSVNVSEGEYVINAEKPGYISSNSQT